LKLAGVNRPNARPELRRRERAFDRVRACVLVLVLGREEPVGSGPIPPRESSDAVDSGATQVAPKRRRGEVLELAGVLGFQSARLPILALNGLVHLLTVYGDLDGGRDPQSDLITPDIHHGDEMSSPMMILSSRCRDRTSIFGLLPPANETRDHP